jgi:hypothetical protein
MPGSRLEKQGNGLLEAKRRRKSAAGAEVRSPATYPIPCRTTSKNVPDVL